MDKVTKLLYCMVLLSSLGWLGSFTYEFFEASKAQAREEGYYTKFKDIDPRFLGWACGQVEKELDKD